MALASGPRVQLHLHSQGIVGGNILVLASVDLHHLFDRLYDKVGAVGQSSVYFPGGYSDSSLLARTFSLRIIALVCIEAAESWDFERGIASQFASLVGFGHFDDGDYPESGWEFLGLCSLYVTSGILV
jgi:hypothetical protein